MEGMLGVEEISEEILDLMAGGAVPGDEKAEMNHYVEVFKGRGFNLKTTQRLWVDHMVKSRISSYSDQEARDYIASIWDSCGKTDE